MKCAVVGAAPVTDYELLRRRLADADFLASADGGSKHLAAVGLVPDLAVGDFDSSAAPRVARETVRLSEEKDDTDLGHAAELLFERGYRDFLFLGVTGGRLDHTLAALAVAAGLAKRGARVGIADERNEMTFLCDGTMALEPVRHAMISVLAFGGAAEGVTLEGLKYPLREARLIPEFPLGVSNEFTREIAKIRVRKGLLCVICTKDEKYPEPTFPLLRIMGQTGKQGAPSI